MSRFFFCLLVSLLYMRLCALALAQEAASADTLKIEGAKASLLSSEKDWGEVPEYVEGATLLRPSTGNVLQFTAKKEVQVLVVVSWFPEDNTPGDWYATRTSQSQLYKQGWEVIGLMKKKNQEYNFVLRKTLKAGEEVKFHTRKISPPLILFPAAGKLAAVAKTPVFKTAAHSLALLKPSAPGPAAAAGKVLLLRTAEPDLYQPFELSDTLLRELVRQAVLLAARDELGLSTRDETLHEYWGEGPADGPLPLDVIVSATEDNRVKVTFCRLRGTDVEILWDEEMRLPPEDDLILALTLKAELLSRKDFVDALKKAGFAGKPNSSFDKKPVPTDVTDAKLHLITQFAAARQLHQLMKVEGESPERLVALARIYAHLGMLSEHFWYQGHKAFMSRGLLYAQRALTRWPQSAAAQYGRGYVRALVGLHGAALEDLAAAARLKGGEKPPEWIAGVESYCRFDLKKLDELAAEKSGLPRLLRLLAQGDLGTPRPIGEATTAVLADVIDCDRAFEVLYRTDHLDASNYSQRQAHRRSGEMTLLHAEKIPGLPAAAAKICKEEMASRTMPGLLDELAEYPRRRAFLEALREEAKADPDEREPSWQVLATLVEESSFVQTARTVLFLQTRLGAASNDVRAHLAPLIAHHPLRDFVEGFTSDITARREYLVNLLRTAPETDFSVNQYEMRIWAHGIVPAEKEDRFAALMLAHQDLVYRDLLGSISIAPDPLKKVFCRELRRVSPHSPLAIVFTIKHDWEFAAPRANDWEKQFADSPQVQLLLGDRYLQEKKYADAIRCLERAAEKRAELDVYQRLAAAWLEQKDEKKWQAAWDKFLTGETFGLAHARARVTVAEHFMMQGRFEEALPYAEAATATNSSWSLTCAGDCLSALKRYEEAEKYWEENAQRYAPDGYIMKYCWRQRVNWGKLDVSRDNIIAYMNRTGVRMSPAYELPFWVLVGEKEKALKNCRQVLVQVPSPQIAWMAAILADELKDSRNRDISLQMVVDTRARATGGGSACSPARSRRAFPSCSWACNSLGHPFQAVTIMASVSRVSGRRSKSP